MSEEDGYVKTILCLANSRKMSGRCVAGKEVRGGSKISGWIRPISSREHQEISESDRRYEDGLYASLLDIVSIPMLKPKPNQYQSENELIDDQFYWKNEGRANWAQIEKAIDNVPGVLWINGFSSGGGQNDRIPQDQAANLGSSLLLIKPTSPKIVVAPKGDPNALQKRGVRVEFKLNNGIYNLGVTDPYVERKYLQGKNGTFPIDGAILCISLGEPFGGYVYKLAAAVITPDRVGKADD
jgi:hypothetical protein